MGSAAISRRLRRTNNQEDEVQGKESHCDLLLGQPLEDEEHVALHSEAVDDEINEDEAFYEANRAEMLEALRKWGPYHLQARGEGGVGLLNQGATCYMNSLLQALFYTPDFRLALYRFRHDPRIHGEESRCIPYQMQRLFAELQLSKASAVSTKDLTAACGFTGRDAMEQHDVQELCRVLFDALERSSTFLAQDIERLYAGQATHYIRTKEQHNGRLYESTRNDKFLDLQVPIQGCHVLEEGLQQLIQPEVLDGDDKWFCEELGEKVAALKGLSFSKLPEILCIQLLRFVFDLSTMRRKKITDAISIPLEVDLSFLCTDRNENQRFELTAVCLHSGTAHGGHYHAFIREPGTENWRDANDANVKPMGEDCTRNLFRPRETTTEDGVVLGPTAFLSADAYFLLYRRIQPNGALTVEEHDVPSALREALAADNEQLETWQRTYGMHRELMEVKVYAPSSPERALRRHAVGALNGLLGDQNVDVEDPQFVTLFVPETQTSSRFLRRVLAAFAKEAEAGDEAWEWATGLREASSNGLARLRHYDAWRGEPSGPLMADRSVRIGELLSSSSSGPVVLLLEVRELSRSFEAYHPGYERTIVCRWDTATAAPSLERTDLVIFRLPGEEGGEVTEGPKPAVAERNETLVDDLERVSSMVFDVVPSSPSMHSTPPVRAAPLTAPAFGLDSEEVPDLFESEHQFRPAQHVNDRSPSVGAVRKAAALHWGVENPSLVSLVVLSGTDAGTVLIKDKLTLHQCGVATGDILCVEVIPQGAEELGYLPQAALLYHEKKNTAHLSFNHPDRPSFHEEFGPLGISKDATVAELKDLVAQVLDLDPTVLHLRLSEKSPQLKDETRTLRQTALAESSTVFVGHGAPCSPEECLLRVSLYTYEKGNQKAIYAFNHPAMGTSSVRSLREALAEPLLRWGRQVADPESEKEGSPFQEVRRLLSQVSLLAGDAPFSEDGFTWKRLRLRDGQAGKQFAILRDERTLRSALPGFFDDRQVCVQVLEQDEELTGDDLLIGVRPWKVNEGRLFAATEIVVNKWQTVADFRASLTARFKNVFPEPHESGQDVLEIVAAPTAGPPLTVKRCESLKWAESRLNPSDEGELSRALHDFKEIRDGVVLIVRSRNAAAEGVVMPAAPPIPKAKGAAGKVFGRGRPMNSGSESSGPSFVHTRQERGLQIEVACPLQDDMSVVVAAENQQHGEIDLLT